MERTEFNKFVTNFLDWTKTVIEEKQPNGWPICPYARKARLDNEIQFIDHIFITNCYDLSVFIIS